MHVKATHVGAAAAQGLSLEGPNALCPHDLREGWGAARALNWHLPAQQATPDFGSGNPLPLGEDADV